MPTDPSLDIRLSADTDRFTDQLTSLEATTHATVVTIKQVRDLYDADTYGDLLVIAPHGRLALISSHGNPQHCVYTDEDGQRWYGDPHDKDGNYRHDPDALLVIATSEDFADLLGPDDTTAKGNITADAAESLAEDWTQRYALPLAVADARRAERDRQGAQAEADAKSRIRALAVYRVAQAAGSQSAAAHALGVSQPTVSDLVKKARQTGAANAPSAVGEHGELRTRISNARAEIRKQDLAAHGTAGGAQVSDALAAVETHLVDREYQSLAGEQA